MSIVCKMTESILTDHLFKHLVTNHVRSQCQHGFVEGKSCITLLLECLDLRTNFIGKGGYVDVIYMDYAKAFDKVVHERLVKNQLQVVQAG